METRRRNTISDGKPEPPFRNNAFQTGAFQSAVAADTAANNGHESLKRVTMEAFTRSVRVA